MRWIILFVLLTACVGQHSFPTYDNWNKKCYGAGKLDWSNCEDKVKALEDIHNGEIDLWHYKRTF